MPLETKYSRTFFFSEVSTFSTSLRWSAWSDGSSKRSTASPACFIINKDWSDCLPPPLNIMMSRTSESDAPAMKKRTIISTLPKTVFGFGWPVAGFTPKAEMALLNHASVMPRNACFAAKLMTLNPGPLQ